MAPLVGHSSNSDFAMSQPTLDELKQKAAQISYPAKDDGKGSARVNWRRRAFYFGKHDTLESYQLFGEWRRRLIETGEPTDVRTIRAELTNCEPDSSYQRNPHHFRILAMSVCLAAFTAILITKVASVGLPPQVDGRSLSEDETNIIRGIRRIEQDVPLSAFPERYADRVMERKKRD